MTASFSLATGAFYPYPPTPFHPNRGKGDNMGISRGKIGLMFLSVNAKIKKEIQEG